MRAVGPVLHYEDERNKRVYQNSPKAVLTHCLFRSHTLDPKSTSDSGKDFSQGKNNNNVNEPVAGAIDAKLLQAQSQLGAVDAAAVAVTTHGRRYSRGVHCGLS